MDAQLLASAHTLLLVVGVGSIPVIVFSFPKKEVLQKERSRASALPSGPVGQARTLR